MREELRQQRGRVGLKFVVGANFGIVWVRQHVFASLYFLIVDDGFHRKHLPCDGLLRQHRLELRVNDVELIEALHTLALGRGEPGAPLCFAR